MMSEILLDAKPPESVIFLGSQNPREIFGLELVAEKKDGIKRCDGQVLTADSRCYCFSGSSSTAQISATSDRASI